MGFYESHGMTPQFTVEVKQRKEVMDEGAGDADKEAMRTLKYGPPREIVKVLDTFKTSLRVQLDCGHVTNAVKGLKRVRCRFCARDLRIEIKGGRRMERQPVQMEDLEQTEVAEGQQQAAETPAGASDGAQGAKKAPAKPKRAAAVKTPPVEAAKPAGEVPRVQRGSGVKYRKSDAPVRDIVGWEKGKSAHTRVAVLSCGHRSASDQSPRKHKRCMACLREGLTGDGAKRAAPAKSETKKSETKKTKSEKKPSAAKSSAKKPAKAKGKGGKKK